MSQLHRGINLFGKVSILLGCIILPFAVIALLDPVGTKMADDSNPFGEPGGPLYPIFLIFISVVLIFCPVALKIYRRKQS